MSSPTGNPRVRVVDVEVLSSGWSVLRKATFDFQLRDGSWKRLSREVYDRGNGAAILLYDPSAGTVLLTRQFRWPVYANGHPDGMLIEAAAGILEDEEPETAIRREAEEETGVRVGEVTPLWEAYMSPGSVSECLHFFAAPYRRDGRVATSGGIVADGEDIEVIELPLAEALAMVEDGQIVDAKTIMLLFWAERTGVCR